MGGSTHHGGGSGLANGGAAHSARPSLPTETFKQLRHAVLTSLDIADNVEHTIDYEDGGGQLQQDIPLESQPSAKEVGKSVFEVRPARIRPARSGPRWPAGRSCLIDPPPAPSVPSGAAVAVRVWLAGQGLSRAAAAAPADATH